MYKFLDIGCKLGDSFNISKQFGYDIEEGIGIDINKEHVIECNKNGIRCIYGDILDIPFKNKFFELSICSHVLEHLDSINLFYDAFNEIIRVTNKYVYVAFPIFDHTEYLKELGLKTFYSDWSSHNCLINLKDFLNLNDNNFNYDITYLKKIEDSNAIEIHSLDSPIDSLDYDPTIHPPKPYVKFDREMYREFYIKINL